MTGIRPGRPGAPKADSRFVPDLSRVNALLDFVRGFALPLRALRLITASRRLLLLSLLSGLVTGAALVMMAVAFWPLSNSWASSLVAGDTGLLKWARLALAVILYVVVLTLGALSVPNVLLAPVGDPISESTELVCGDFEPPKSTLTQVLRGTALSLSHTLVRILLMVFGMVVLWPLHFVPLIGGFIWLVVSSLWSMFWLATEHLSTPMARHLYPFSKVVRILRRRLALALGFGAALSMLLWVPIVNFFLLPVAIIAGTLLYRGLVRIHGPSLD